MKGKIHSFEKKFTATVAPLTYYSYYPICRNRWVGTSNIKGADLFTQFLQDWKTKDFEVIDCYAVKWEDFIGAIIKTTSREETIIQFDP